jgi:hypothetical protein
MMSPVNYAILTAALDKCRGNQAALARALSREMNRAVDRSIVNKMLLRKRGMNADELLALRAIATADEAGPTQAPETTGTPASQIGAKPMREISEEDTPYIADDARPEHKGAVERLLRDRPDAHAKVMASNILALQGVRPGDIVIIDRAATPKAGDLVAAQVIDGTDVRTIYRLYQPPNLVAAGFDPASVRPELVDGERVSIAGVMTDLLRKRQD